MSQEMDHTHSEEHHHHDEHHHDECICKSKFFKKFLTIALGTFVGGYCALSLFCALHKPPMMMSPFMYHSMMHQQMMGNMGIRHNCNCPCHKMLMKKHFEKMNENAIKHQEEDKD